MFSEEIKNLVGAAGLLIREKNGEEVICTKQEVPFYYTYHKPEEYIKGFLRGMVIGKNCSF